MTNRCFGEAPVGLAQRVGQSQPQGRPALARHSAVFRWCHHRPGLRNLQPRRAQPWRQRECSVRAVSGRWVSSGTCTLTLGLQLANDRFGDAIQTDPYILYSAFPYYYFFLLFFFVLSLSLFILFLTTTSITTTTVTTTVTIGSH